MISKTINVNELQAQISSILKDVQQDTVYQVIRYSKPIAVVVSFDEYSKLKGECKHCILELKEIAGYIQSGKAKRRTKK